METKKAALGTASQPLAAPVKTQFVATAENSHAMATIQEI